MACAETAYCQAGWCSPLPMVRGDQQPPSCLVSLAWSGGTRPGTRCYQWLEHCWRRSASRQQVRAQSSLVPGVLPPSHPPASLSGMWHRVTCHFRYLSAMRYACALHTPDREPQHQLDFMHPEWHFGHLVLGPDCSVACPLLFTLTSAPCQHICTGGCALAVSLQ